MLFRRTFSSLGTAATAVGDYSGNAAGRVGAITATGIRTCGSDDPRTLPNADLLNGSSFDKRDARLSPLNDAETCASDHEGTADSQLLRRLRGRTESCLDALRTPSVRLALGIRSGVVAKPRIEFCHCSCGKSLILC